LNSLTRRFSLQKIKSKSGVSMSGGDYKHTNTTHELRDIHFDGSIDCCVHRNYFY
jgi:ABC-type lipopolysaccharide export system ATPase subunit